MLNFISIHAPREGRDVFKGDNLRRDKAFQSTRPARGATEVKYGRIRVFKNFNPRAPRGARPTAERSVPACKQISIHAPREGRDKPFVYDYGNTEDFNPRAPRGARREFFF